MSKVEFDELGDGVGHRDVNLTAALKPQKESFTSAQRCCESLVQGWSIQVAWTKPKPTLP